MESMRRVFEHDMAVYLLVLLAVWVVYALLVTFAPANLNLSRYGITIAQGHVLQITVLLPQLLIWVSALYAYLRFNGYARLVGNSPEASGFKHMEWGLLMLFLVLVIPAWVGLHASYSPESDLVQKVVVVLRNYTSLFLYALAFGHIFMASRKLNQTLQKSQKDASLPAYPLIPLLIGITSIFYLWAIYSNELRTSSSDPLIRATYYLPDWLIITTIFIPHVIVWLWGSLAIFNIRHFARHVPGVLYRKAFIQVANGLSVLLVLLISLQFFTQAAGAFTEESLRLVLFMLYVLIVVIALAYLLLAKGARELAAIEEA